MADSRECLFGDLLLTELVEEYQQEWLNFHFIIDGFEFRDKHLKGAQIEFDLIGSRQQEQVFQEV